MPSQALEPWQASFQALIEQAGHPRWSQRPPKLIIKRQGLSPWWSPALWLAHRPSAWSAWNCVIVSEEMLSRPPNRYLLAHELGHLHHLHHAQYQATSLALLLCASLLYAYGPAAALAVKLLGLALILALGLRLIELCSLKAEYQADAFAARLIGAEEVAKGIQAHARKTKAGISAGARRRLAWLAAHRPQKTA
jgi:Zn-dependent protease with chaperone function